MTFRTVDYFTSQIANVYALENVFIEIDDWKGQVLGFISKNDDTISLMTISIDPCPLDRLLDSGSLHIENLCVPISFSSCFQPSGYSGRDDTFIRLSMLMQAGWRPCNEISSSPIWIEDFYYTTLTLGVLLRDIPQIAEGSLFWLET